MPHTPKTLFGKPPLCIPSPLSSSETEEGNRMWKGIKASFPTSLPTYSPHWAGPCPLLSTTASADSPAPPSPQVWKAPTLGENVSPAERTQIYFVAHPWDIFRAFTNGVIEGKVQGQLHAGLGPSGCIRPGQPESTAGMQETARGLCLRTHPGS